MHNIASSSRLAIPAQSSPRLLTYFQIAALELEFSQEFNEFCALVDMSWSPDSQRLAFLRQQENDGTPQSQLLVYSVYNLISEDVESDWSDLWEFMPAVGPLTLDWSPNGQWLAIPLRRSDHTMRLIIINTHTKEIEPDWIEYPLPDFGNSIRSLRWSPDSKRIAIVYLTAIYSPELGRELRPPRLNSPEPVVAPCSPGIHPKAPISSIIASPSSRQSRSTAWPII